MAEDLNKDVDLDLNQQENENSGSDEADKADGQNEDKGLTLDEFQVVVDTLDKTEQEKNNLSKAVISKEEENRKLRKIIRKIKKSGKSDVEDDLDDEDDDDEPSNKYVTKDDLKSILADVLKPVQQQAVTEAAKYKKRIEELKIANQNRSQINNNNNGSFDKPGVEPKSDVPASILKQYLNVKPNATKEQIESFKNRYLANRATHN